MSTPPTSPSPSPSANIPHSTFHIPHSTLKVSYNISALAPYINWPYFYFAWQVKDPSEKSRLRQEAETILQQLEGRYHAYGLFELFSAYSSGDDIVVFRGELVTSSPPEFLRPFGSKRAELERGGEPEGRGGLKRRSFSPPMSGGAGEGLRIPCLRQQQGTPPYLCLSDFLPPLSNHKATSLKLNAQSSKLALFSTSVSPSLESDFDADPYMKMMTQLLADRLAEAAAERMHEQVRKEFWGYAKDENLSIPDMLVEKFQGIRPAVGYPSLPDTSLNFIIDDLIDMSQIGIRLTESGAMKPHASVSGLMLAHPQARYFSIGKIGEDQLRDYASRRGLPLELIRRFLASNL